MLGIVIPPTDNHLTILPKTIPSPSSANENRDQFLTRDLLMFYIFVLLSQDNI